MAKCYLKATYTFIVTFGILLRAQIQEVRSEYFKSDYPASTLVQVSQLSDKDLLIEVEVVAAL